MTESGSEILKVDEAGRVRTPPEKREALLAEFDRSGMTGAQFARECQKMTCSRQEAQGVPACRLQ
jgi:hypothetical protein